MFRFSRIVFPIALVVASAIAQRPQPPTRDPHTSGYVNAKELPDGENAPPNVDGNFIIGPTHTPAPESTVHEGVPQGTIHKFDMESADSKIYPGIAREPNTFGTTDPSDPAKLIVTTSHPKPYTRHVAVYVPQQYVPGTEAPFIVGADGPDMLLFTVLDNLIAEHKVPAMIAISIGNGSGDAQGSERGLEYDTMSGLYAEWVEKEVLPLVEKQYNVKLTKDPDGRATTGNSSGGSCALIMAWYHPEWYHRVLTYSGTYVNQQWPQDPKTAARRLGLPRTPDSEKPQEADPPLDGGRRQRPLQSQHHARRHARLGCRQREYGESAGRQGLPLPVRLRAKRRPRRWRHAQANPARSAGIFVAGLSHRRQEALTREVLVWTFNRVIYGTLFQIESPDYYDRYRDGTRVLPPGFQRSARCRRGLPRRRMPAARIHQPRRPCLGSFQRAGKYCAREIPEMILGVGSVVDPGTASLYINCGANFVVGPLLNPDVARACNRRKIPYSPGCGSATEISQAEELGCEILKIFPGKEVGGPGFVKAIKGPCPWVSIMPTGGVESTEASLKGWFDAGVVCVGMGSNLITKDLIKAGDYEGIAAKVRDTLGLIDTIRRKK